MTQTTSPATSSPAGGDDARALHLDRTAVFHHWATQSTRAPIVVATGQGSWVQDHAGRRYLDFTSQLVNANIGHQHPRVVEAIRAQAEVLTTTSPNNANLVRGRAAEAVLRHAPAGFTKVFFTNGGSDAVEHAIRMARLHTGRDKIVSHYRSYHGATGTSIVATGELRRVGNEYARGHVHVFGPYLYRTEFWASTPQEECARALHHLERVIQAEGPSSIAALIFESVPGTAGVLVPPPGYLAGVRQIADRYDLVLILDEVMAGFGRTGSWLALDQHDVVPDLITFAKGVTSGYVPLGGVMLSGRIAEALDDVPYNGGLTYGGHPLATATALATIEAMEDEGVVEHAAQIGREAIGPGLAELAATRPAIGEVRGTGVFWAMDLVADPATREPLPAATMARLKQGAIERGLLPFIADNRWHIVPPCVVTADEVRRGLEIVADVLDSVV